MAEVAILTREAVTCFAEVPRTAGFALALAVSPLARAGRIAAAVALRPSVALDLAVGHILLTDIGLPDENLQSVVARALQSPVARTRERLPHRALEQEWLAALAGLADRPGTR